MKVIFLDFDGVLNNAESTICYAKKIEREEIPPSMSWKFWDSMSINLIDKLCELTDAKVVLSTSWRSECDTRWFMRIADNYAPTGICKIDCIDHTPFRLEGTHHTQPLRGLEIQAWLDGNRSEGVTQEKPTHYVIIDDSADLLDHQRPHHVQPWVHTGFRLKHFVQALTLLRGKAEDIQKYEGLLLSATEPPSRIIYGLP